ncbi:hypothetical protein FRC04_004263 [Tulasnella sp. 424]|nr:hypothetical protein FRC04_004263 [Tulasnella sp. 424]
MTPNTAAATSLQNPTSKPNSGRSTNMVSSSEPEPPTVRFQDLSIGEPRPPQSKRHLYQKRRESSTTKKSSSTTGPRAASLPDQLHDTVLQERLEEEGLADIEEDDEQVRVQRRVVSVAVAGRSKEARLASLMLSTSKRPPERSNPASSSEPQEAWIDELSSMSISENNSFHAILTQELRALQDGTRSPKLGRSPTPPSRSSTSSPETVIFDNKEAEIIQPNSFLWPKSRVACPEGQSLPLGFEGHEVRTEGSSANPLLDSVQTAKPPSLLPHACSFGIPLHCQALPFGRSSDSPIASPSQVHWISPPKSIPALHGPLSIPYARCPSGAEGEVYDGNLHVHDLVWPAYQERGLMGEPALHPDYVAAVDDHDEEYQVKTPDVVVLVDANLARGNQAKGRHRSNQARNRLSRPLTDATNPQQPRRTPSLHNSHESPQLGLPAWRVPSSRPQGARRLSPACHYRDSGLMVDPAGTTNSPIPTVYTEPMRSTTPLLHSQHLPHPAHGRLPPSLNSTSDGGSVFIQQAIIDQERERLHLEEQELQRRLEEEYRRLGRDREQLCDNANTLARNLGDIPYKEGTLPVQQNDGFWMYNHWSHPATPTIRVQSLHGPPMVTSSTHGHYLGAGNPIAPLGPLPYITTSPDARYPDMEQPVGLGLLHLLPPSNVTHGATFNAAPGYASPLSRASPHKSASYHVPYPLGLVGISSPQEQSPPNGTHPEPRDARHSQPESAPLSQTHRPVNHSRLPVQLVIAPEEDGDHTLSHAQDPGRAHPADSSQHKSAPFSRFTSRRSNVLQPIAARLSSISPGAECVRNTTPPAPRASPRQRRQTYAETLGKGLPTRPNLDGLPTPPGSSVSNAVTVGHQEKYEILPPTPPALEPNALSLAWGEPLLEQLPGSWNTSDDGSASHCASSGITPATNKPEGRIRRRNRKKGSKRVLAEGL